MPLAVRVNDFRSVAASPPNSALTESSVTKRIWVRKSDVDAVSLANGKKRLALKRIVPFDCGANWRAMTVRAAEGGELYLGAPSRATVQAIARTPCTLAWCAGLCPDLPDVRSIVYQRAKGAPETAPFGTQVASCTG